MSLKKTLSYSGMSSFLLRNEKEARDLYFKKEYTARQLAEHFGILYNPNFQKACFRILGSKKMGLGGKRTGAGNFREKKKEVRKSEWEIITISLSPDAMKVLKSLQGTYSRSIEKILLEYKIHQE